MRFRRNIGIDTDCESGLLTKMHGPRGQQLQFTGTLDVEQQNSGVQALVDLVRQLTYAGENNLVRGFARCRVITRCSSPPETISKPAPMRASIFRIEQIRVRLHRVADGVLAAAKRLVEDADIARE